ncbi:MAG: hypothetical protein KDD56_10515, partial [Bdellovibrionales bacterium]|nr:hypothetical protein [Bdellovibrionales bacterium]
MVQLVQNRKPKELEALTPEAGIDTEQLDTERLPEPKLEKAAPPTEAELDDIILNGAGSTTSISVQAPHTARSNIESAPQTTELSSDLRSLLTDRILKNEPTKAIVEALGGVKNLTDEKLSELNRLASRPEVIDKVLEFANKDISQIAKDSGYDKQELLKNLINHLANPNKDYNIGGRDNCTAGGALGALLIEKPEAYAEKVIELFTSENASIDTGFTDANGQAVKISLSRSALKDAPTDLVGGMKPADMLELGMQASYMDAAVKSAWKVHLDSVKGKAWLAKWREDNPEKAKQLPSGQQPFYNPRIDKVVYPDGTEFSGLNREEDHAMEILVHGGAKRLDMHQLVQNSNVRDLFDQSPLTRERLNEISNKLNSEESLTVLGISASEREELKGFLDLVNTAIEKGESGEPQTFGAVVYYKSGHLVDKGSLHKIMVQVEDEGENGIQVKFYNTWGKTESDFDKHPFTGAEKTEGNTYKCSLKDFIQN